MVVEIVEAVRIRSSIIVILHYNVEFPRVLITIEQHYCLPENYDVLIQSEVFRNDKLIGSICPQNLYNCYKELHTFYLFKKAPYGTPLFSCFGSVIERE